MPKKIKYTISEKDLENGVITIAVNLGNKQTHELAVPIPKTVMDVRDATRMIPGIITDEEGNQSDGEVSETYKEEFERPITKDDVLAILEREADQVIANRAVDEAYAEAFNLE